MEAPTAARQIGKAVGAPAGSIVFHLANNGKLAIDKFRDACDRRLYFAVTQGSRFMANTAIPSRPATLAAFAEGSFARKAAIAVTGSLFLSAMSQIAIGWPVPTTLQTLAVILIGLTFCFRLATATLALYLAEGAIGLPVFALFKPLLPLGPSAGYLLGFLFQVAIIGWLVDRGLARGFLGAAVAVLIGEVVMFASGAAWLSTFMGQPSLVENLTAAFKVGVVPFIAVDLVKAALAILLAKGVLAGAARMLRG
jgi:biotin transport system substrate-specific component